MEKEKNILNFLVKIVLIYLAFLCLIISVNFLFHIRDILNGNDFSSIAGIFFLAIYLFILTANIVFLIKTKTREKYKVVLLFNIVFSIISCFGVRVHKFIIANILGIDFSLFYIKAKAGYKFLFYYDTFDFTVQFKHSDVSDPVFGIQVNFIMLSIGVFLFICYRKIPKWLNNHK